MTAQEDTRPSLTDSPVIARTELTPPRLRPETIPRDSLVDRRMTSSARLGVISGPPGSGKSTVLAQCHAADPHPAWLSLGPNHNDPVVLWWALIESIREVLVGFGEAYQHRLLVAGTSVLDEIVASVANELADGRTPVHLFIDDAQLLDDLGARRSLHALVISVPAGVRVTIASREAGPIPLARLRAEADLVEIGASDLALSGDESRSLLTNLCEGCQPGLTEPLIAKTEGWPAGLILAGMALASSPDSAAFVEEFSGSDRSIAEYLLSEVLANVSVAEREFMFETSLLSRLCADLCHAVTGRADSADLLEALERTNGFVIPLDRDGVWFRYHHLFADLLTSELERRHPTKVPDLHARAYTWFRDRGQIEEAIHHALAANHSDDAADLVCEHWYEMLNTGRLETVRNLIERFEPDEIAGHQPLANAAALVFAMSGNHRSARHYLRAAEHGTYDGPSPDGAATMESSLALTRAGLALDGIDRALADAELAYRLEPSASQWKGLAALVIGLARAMKGDVEGAAPFLEEASDGPDAAGSAYALADLAIVRLTLGNPELAVETADRACKIIAAEGLEDIFFAATAEAASALAALATGDERSARTSLRRSVRPMQSAGSAMPMDAMHTHLLLAEVALELGEHRVAGTHLEGASQIAAAIADTGTMSDRLAELAGRLPPSDGIADEEPEFTDRELEVITLLPSGLTTREIGEEMFLSRNTIKTYLRRIYRKLDASSRDEAVETARELHLISIS